MDAHWGTRGIVMKIAGLDIGTTGCKCTVFDRDGACLGKAYRDYPVKRVVSGHEVDVAAIMDGVYGVLAEMAGQYPDISGIGVTSFGETFVLTDGAGQPLHTAMLYTDPRGEAECSRLKEAVGERRIAEITGLRPHEMYSISKLMWMRTNCPDIYEKAACIFLMEDYVVYHLTGKRQIDYSLATRTMAFHIRELDWSSEILEAAGIERERLSVPVPTGTDAGVILAEAALRTGLSPKTHIVSVSHDQVAAAVGAGAFDGDVAVDGAGTVECVTPIFDSLPDIDVMYKGYFSIVPYVIPGKYVAYAFSYTGGALLQWCTDTLAKKEKELAEKEHISANEYLEKRYMEERSNDKFSQKAGADRKVAMERISDTDVADKRAAERRETEKPENENIEMEKSKAAGEKTGEDPTGLLVLPHFAGTATPYMDTGSKGAILGLTAATTTADIYRACMEGVVYEMYLNVKALQGSGIRFTRMHATGGGARSAEWMQMKADMLNVPITALKTADAGTVGSAMLTGIAVGIFADLEDAAAHMVEKAQEYYPRREMHEKYLQVFERYEKVYEAVRPLV